MHNSKLPFSHGPKPFRDFLIFARKNTFSPSLSGSSDKSKATIEFGLRDAGLAQHPMGTFGIIETFLICQDMNINAKFIFSGYLQCKGRMYMGQQELPCELCSSNVLENLDGYFTFAATEADAVTITQDIFGKNTIFYCIYDDFALASNRYHLLLLYLSWLGIKPAINYDKVLLLMASEGAEFAQQEITRDMFFENQFMLTMTEKLVINANGFHVAEKPRAMEAFLPASETEIKGLFEQGVEEIKENGRAVFSRPWKDGVKVDISGGWDSRISAAAILATGNRDFTVRTRMVFYGDVVVSELITKQFDLERGNPDFYPILHYESIDEPINNYRSFAMGFTFQKIYSSTYVSPDAEILRIGGDFGEIYKAYYMRQFLSDDFFTNFTVEALIKKFVSKYPFADGIKGSEPLLKRISNALISEVQAIPGELAQDKFNHLYYFYLLRAHFGYSNGYRHVFGYVWSPLTSLSAFRYHNSIPYHKRYERHPYIVNSDLAHAVFPPLASVPFAVNEGVRYVTAGAAVDDVTHLYKDYDISEWRKHADLFKEDSRHRARSTGSNPDIFKKAWAEIQNPTYMLRESLAVFDRLSSIDNAMCEIFNSALRERIKNCGLPSPINSYYVRLMQLADILGCFDLLPYSQSFKDTTTDDVPRPRCIFKLQKIKQRGYDADKIAKDSGIYLVGGEFADFSSKTPLSAKVTYEMPLSDRSKIELFSMEWLGVLLDAYENKGMTGCFKICENVLTAYYTYLVWGPVNLWEERQQLPDQTTEAYAKRVIGIAHMLKLAPECWFFAGNTLKILRQHAEYLLIHYSDTENGELLVSVALRYAAEILSGDKNQKEYEHTASKRLQEAKETVGAFLKEAEQFHNTLNEEG